MLKEAKAAYRERKAEVVAERRADSEARQASRALEQFSFDDRSTTSRDGRKSKSRSRNRRMERRPSERHSYSKRGRLDELSIREDEAGVPATSSGREQPIRRHTAQDEQALTKSRLPPRSASYSEPHIDMDLAYGELPPPIPVPDQRELNSLMSKVNQLLDEAHCVQHSITATISTLQKNPDALAAVALTLAEISNIAAKMAPGALTAMKGSFPAVVALLASPQFMIAAGVGVGVVVVALGGYKIIKKIKQARHEDETDELLELSSDIDRIECWRRGVAVDVETASVATSVEGEFITPEAAAMRRATLAEEGEELRREREETSRVSRRERQNSEGKKKSRKTPKSHRVPRSATGEREEGSERRKKKQSSPSQKLKLLFR